MAYYHELITEKSWQLLQELKRQHQFVLIGGWAVFVYTHSLNSKDIDIICDYQELEKLKARYVMTKNDRLKKYEIKVDGIDVDIYTPYFSDLGISPEAVVSHKCAVEGFQVPEKEVLLLLKLKAWLDRGHSLKGEKDKLDIIALLLSGINAAKIKALIKEFKVPQYQNALLQILRETKEAPELDLNVHAFSRRKKQILAAFD